MKAVIQRVSEAGVSINGGVKSSIGRGLLVYLGIDERDNHEQLRWLVNKIANMRIFPDVNGRMNQNIQDVGGAFLLISQFTLIASTKKGQRPSFSKAAHPKQAIPLYEKFIEFMKTSTKLRVETGEFGADMQVHAINDGPVTLIIDTWNR